MVMVLRRQRIGLEPPAVMDALVPVRVKLLDMPATGYRVWRAIPEAGGA